MRLGVDGEPAPPEAGLSAASVVLDCRWLGMGGAGRLTELLLADLAKSPPPGRWVLWGRPALVRPLAFPRARIAPATSDPRSLLGQRETARVPRGDVVVYMHQIRPLHPGRSVTFILDTIPLRYGGVPPLRLAKRLFFHAAARLSTRIVTISAFSKACIERDLGVPADRIGVVDVPLDEGRARRVAALREHLPAADVVLYVGRFDAHKNLERLCLAFRATRFARRGGRLLMVGGWPGETERMRAWVERRGVPGVDLRPACSDGDLERLMATSRALVVPSLEEGYGLPAFEAAAAGLPVAASRTGAMGDLPPEAAVLFDPLSLDEMRDAVDEAAARSPRPPPVVGGSTLGSAVLAAVASCLDAPSGDEAGPSARIEAAS